MQSAMAWTLVVCWCVALLVSGFPSLETRRVKGKGVKGKHSHRRPQAANLTCRYELTQASQDNIGGFKNETRAVKLITSPDACYVIEGKRRCHQTQITRTNDTSVLLDFKGGEKVALPDLTDRLTESCQDHVIFRVNVVFDRVSGNSDQQP